MATTTERVDGLVAPIASDLGLEVYDVELSGGVLRVVLQRPGGGLGLDDIAEATRRVSRALDEADPVPGSYTLEVSSPGLERTLRKPEHYAGAVGERVSVKTRPGTEGERRVEGVLSAFAEDVATITLDDGSTREVALGDVQRARTRFEWGPAPKPGKSRQTERRRSDEPADHNSEATR